MGSTPITRSKITAPGNRWGLFLRSEVLVWRSGNSDGPVGDVGIGPAGVSGNYRPLTGYKKFYLDFRKGQTAGTKAQNHGSLGCFGENPKKFNKNVGALVQNGKSDRQIFCKLTIP